MIIICSQILGPEVRGQAERQTGNQKVLKSNQKRKMAVPTEGLGVVWVKQTQKKGGENDDVARAAGLTRMRDLGAKGFSP